MMPLAVVLGNEMAAVDKNARYSEWETRIHLKISVHVDKGLANTHVKSETNQTHSLRDIGF